MDNVATMSKRKMLGIVLLPGFIPRFRVLFGQGFAYIPFFIALVYRCVRLLPANHPYLNPANMGRFGIRNVIGEAANHLVLSRKNIDQILLFLLIIVGMIIIALQFLLVGLGLFIQSGYAFPQNFNEFFVTEQPAQDIAFILLDMVFGVPEMFLSCVDPAGGAVCQNSFGQDILISADHPTLGGQPYTQFATWPWPIHQGLHQLFALFSYGMMVVAVIITVYFMITVISESAQSGTAFGRRFNKVWAPIRIVVAFGLLIPLVYGLNSGQYIVLYAAKYGSGFATNGWIYFNTMINEHYHEDMHELVAKPEFPESATLMQFFYSAATCASMYSMIDNLDIRMYAVRDTLQAPSHFEIGPLGNGMADGGVTGTVDYNALMGWNGQSKQIYFRIGHRSQNDYPSEKGHVKPLCGEVTMTLSDPREPGESEPGTETLQRFYYWVIKKLWFNAGHMQAGAVPNNQRYDQLLADKHSSELDDSLLQTIDEPSDEWRTDNIERMTELFSEVLTGGGGPDPVNGNAIDAMMNSDTWDLEADLIASKGWAGAAIWYNRIADMNGALTSAVFNIPMPTKYPSMMEYVAAKKKQYDQEVKVEERFNPNLPNGDVITFPDPQRDYAKANAMWDAFSFWNKGANATSVYTTPSGNIFNDAVMAIFGTEGLYDMRNNEDVHPLAQLTAIGRALVESAVRNMGYIAVGGSAGFLLNSLGLTGAGGTAKVISSFLVSITMVGLTIGFVLFYVVPFLPFIYFFFAVGGWIKGIFEAMVGIPLWALAHIRIDGEGLPGNAAVNGYFLIFEIFVRPILIIFGFLASILIFSAMVETLNSIFDLVSANVGGFSMTTEKAATIKQIEFYRSAIDQFMFTVMYAIIVYLLGQSSFKLIDLIPNNILRWMGQSVTTFNDERADPAENLVGRAKMGAQQAIGSIGGGVKSMVS